MVNASESFSLTWNDSTPSPVAFRFYGGPSHCPDIAEVVGMSVANRESEWMRGWWVFRRVDWVRLCAIVREEIHRHINITAKEARDAK